ncbi:S24 family peptidase [Desulfobulbus sp.]|uniref:LexA family transcriptional regulator n=1 Tax=Desulfobulbus sp. TaxID=895 RepID=UPI0028524D39|nr:S24 family peptidase [Desulfobulbus sp.]
MKLTGWTQKRQLADFLGIKGQSVSGARTRNSFPADWAYRIASEFGGNTDWIIEGRGPIRHEGIPIDSRSTRVSQVTPTPKPCTIDESGRVTIPSWQNPDPEMFDYIPMADAKLSAGGGCFVLSEDMRDYYAFRKSWLYRVASSPKSVVLMRVQGSSMDPTIQDGDAVMIDTGRRDIKEGMIYALRVDSTVMIKRLSFRIGGKVRIISDNRQDFEPYEADTKDLHIIGQIIFFCRSFISD